MNIGIVINHSSKWFISQAEKLSTEIGAAGHTAVIGTNVRFLSEKNYPFERCIFLDKDFVLAQRMELEGVRLFNSAGAIELCDDKRRTYEMLRNDFPVPETVSMPLTYFPEEEFFTGFADDLEKRFGFPMIAKLASGSQGRQVSLLTNRAGLDAYIRQNYAVPHLYQKFIASSRGKDLRVYVVGNEVTGAMIRENRSDFRSNIAMGGNGRKFVPSPEICEECVAVTEFLGLDFAGIDLLFGENGEMLICEVNSNALFGTLDIACGTNTAEKIAKHVLSARNFSENLFL